jgi:hypothetical protein
MLALERINHNLDGNYVFALHSAATAPKALGRCSGVQLGTDLVVVICWEALTRVVVVNGGKDL